MDDAWREDVLGEREKRFLAERLERDGDNRTLFSYILPYATIDDYERQSKDVWRTDKSKMMSKELVKNSKFYSMISFGGTLTQPESMLLHAALQAKARGYPGFTYFQPPARPNFSYVQFVRPDEPGTPQAFYLDADAVIAELRQLIPSPAELAERKKQKRK